MTARVTRKRNKTARRLAEISGISERTVRRYIASRRGYYLRTARQRRNRAKELREKGFTYREIGIALSGISRQAARSLCRRK